jgi:hypothetical protein
MGGNMVKAKNLIDALTLLSHKAGYTTLFTSAPEPENTDFVVFQEPELVNEVLRVRYNTRTDELVDIKTTDVLRRKLKEIEEVVG